MSAPDVILDIRGLNKSFTAKRAGRAYRIRAVSDVNLAVRRGEVLGIVGESGCGKTTVGRTIMGLTAADSGEAVFEGVDILRQRGAGLRAARLKLRMVFQDPYASLNPRRSVADAVAEAGDIHGVFADHR